MTRKRRMRKRRRERVREGKRNAGIWKKEEENLEKEGDKEDGG